MKNVKKRHLPQKSFIIQNLLCKVSFLHIEQIHLRIKTVPLLIWRCLFFFLTPQFFSKFSRNGRKPTQTATKHKIYHGKGKFPNRISQK